MKHLKDYVVVNGQEYYVSTKNTFDVLPNSNRKGRTHMKKVCITYHMHFPGEEVESCIVLPMEDKIADDLLEKGMDSVHMMLEANGEVARLLRSLADIQGYRYDGAVGFELDE